MSVDSEQTLREERLADQVKLHGFLYVLRSKQDELKVIRDDLRWLESEVSQQAESVSEGYDLLSQSIDELSTLV